jgi:hypothetical protein
MTYPHRGPATTSRRHTFQTRQDFLTTVKCLGLDQNPRSLRPLPALFTSPRFLPHTGILSTMASIIRSAKSASSWTESELVAYGISVTEQSPEDFHGTPLPAIESISNLDPHLVSGTLSTQGLSDRTLLLLHHLDLASGRQARDESAVDDFAKEMLFFLGYQSRGLVLRCRQEIPLTVCGDTNRSAQTDVSLLQGSTTILLIVQEDKTIFNNSDPEPQVIAEAIAAFQSNNRARQDRHLHMLDKMTIPCIIMVGTLPTFYLVPVTEELSNAVSLGRYPFVLTMVTKCVVADDTVGVSGKVPESELSDIRCIPWVTLCNPGYACTGYPTARSPALYLVSHSRGGPLVGLYNSGGRGFKLTCLEEKL